jgi:hypothetical protein
MLEDVKRPARTGSPYGPLVLDFDPAEKQRVLMQAHRARAGIVRSALRRPTTAFVHRVRLAGFAAGRFLFDHGGVRSVHH